MGSLNRGRTPRAYAAGRLRARPWRIREAISLRSVPFGLDEDGLIDRLHARVHALIMREMHTQVRVNLFRTPPDQACPR